MNSDDLTQMTMNGYDLAAEEFSRSRPHFWGELAYLLEYAKPKMRILDLGCGNGRLYDALNKQTPDIDYTGVDNSKNLLEIASTRYPDATFLAADARALPFPDKSFDVIYSFAVLHHIQSKREQLAFLSEAIRVLKHDGVLIVTTWKLNGSKYFWRKLSYFAKQILIGNTIEFGDMILPLGSTGGARFVHVFSHRELRLLASKLHLSIELSQVAHGKKYGNIVAVLRKKT